MYVVVKLEQQYRHKIVKSNVKKFCSYTHGSMYIVHNKIQKQNYYLTKSLTSSLSLYV